MYYDYFGLKQPPFRITPDTTLFFPGGNRGPILEALVYAILSGEGIIKVVGEVGSGKTMLCRMLEKELPGHIVTVYLANPSLSPENILHAIAFELKLPVQSATSRLQVMQDLQDYLLERHAANRQVLVFVEEAQGMPIATLEQIRLLSNLETQQHKLLQLVLFGQPELDARLVRPEIRQLKERITYSFHLTPFAAGDVRDYLNSRLRACGFRGAEVFTPAAVRAIARYSQGLVRRINILADKSLLAAYADNTHEVSARHVRRAASDSEFAGRRRWLPFAGGALALAAAVALWQLAGTPAEAPVARPSAVPVEVPSPPPEESDGAAPAGTGPAAPAPAAERALHEPRRPEVAEVAPAPVLSPAADVARAAETVATDLAPVPASGAAVAEAPATPAIAAPAAEKRGGDAQLLGMSAVFRFQDFGDSRLSPEEAALLEKQLAAMPPEEAIPEGLSPGGDVCRLCWSIIYRPLKSPENL